MTPFVILGTQRTGTTLIRTSLDSHPAVQCRGEVFVVGRWPLALSRTKPYTHSDGFWAYRRRNGSNRMLSLVARRRSIATFLDELYAPGARQAIGFKLMLSEARRFPEVLAYLKQRQVKAIHVLRRNVLNTFISRESARLTGVYHVRNTDEGTGAGARPPRRAKPRLDPRTLVAKLRSIAAEDAEWTELISHQLPVHRVVYEDFVRNQADTSAAMLEFIGIPPATLTSDLKKIVPDDWRAAVANSDEVERALKGSEFESVLVQPSS